MENRSSLGNETKPADRAANDRLAEFRNGTVLRARVRPSFARFVTEAARTGWAALDRARRSQRREVPAGVGSWLGRASAFLFFVGMVTGVFLMFHYRPTVEHAYNDVLALRDATTPGVLRELHRWGAHALIVVACLHLYRVFLTGRYKPPRGGNWGIGVLLLVSTLLLSFTGHLLPWDQKAYWGVAVVVAANATPASPVADAAVSGSDASATLDGATLNLFYGLHCVVIPMAASLLIRFHVRRARRDDALDRPS